MNRVACVGAGTVGQSWAITFARAGHEVWLWDQDPEAAVRAAAAAAAALAATLGAGSVRAAGALEEAVGQAAYVQESIVEQVGPKRALFARLDALTPGDTILASSSSAIPPTVLFEPIAGRARCIVAHPVNPPHLIRLVEVCGAAFTASDVVDRTVALMRDIGQSPIVIGREVDGFVLNRLQWALLNEAIHLVGEGYCSVGDVDLAMTEGLAPRWILRGPFATIHLNATRGVAGYFAVLAEALERVRKDIDPAYVPSPKLIASIHAEMAAQVPVDAIPSHQRVRDREITALGAFLAGRQCAGEGDRPHADQDRGVGRPTQQQGGGSAGRAAATSTNENKGSEQDAEDH